MASIRPSISVSDASSRDFLFDGYFHKSPKMTLTQPQIPTLGILGGIFLFDGYFHKLAIMASIRPSISVSDASSGDSLFDGYFHKPPKTMLIKPSISIPMMPKNLHASDLMHSWTCHWVHDLYGEHLAKPTYYPQYLLSGSDPLRNLHS